MRASRVPIVGAGVALGVAVLAFTADAVALGDAGQSWDILTGTAPPWGKSPALGVALSAVGYLLVPTFIGLSAVWAVDRMSRRLIQESPSGETHMITLTGLNTKKSKKVDVDP